MDSEGKSSIQERFKKTKNILMLKDYKKIYELLVVDE